ncbi:Fur family transcriptional regulator [Ornithinimicrobium cavernae]|uniref:Fur family transcriptional regulator n=1 Tax=Ornithinimicrobium cavernae TaxID=2666047 RepID=UPI00235153D0|nr:Fur family transcriptional regulator [Ornithinimicrobium cavernae]
MASHVIPAPAVALREAGLRVTRPRVAVLEALTAGPHSSADAVHERVQGQVGPVSRQAVYDVLHALTEVGLVRRILVGNVARYELDLHDNHHHLLCRGCGALADVPCAVGEAPCLVPSHDHGFAVEVADVLYSGLCPNCRAVEGRAEPHQHHGG